MDGVHMLTGSQLVAKGVSSKVDVKLPGLGFKEVSPTGSWLEQKQIQSALEARKHLIEVERIEKSGSLSIALWRDDLELAEVIQKTGGHWQYIGHNVGKHLYLQPEETLFLMEINCLLLKHNEVIVSLQKAYSLCLRVISIEKYKVYASLSRLGYRVFRHEEPKKTHDNMNDKQFDSEEHHMTDRDFRKYPVIIKEHTQKDIEIDGSLSDKSKDICDKIVPNSTADPESVQYINYDVNGYNISESDTTPVVDITVKPICDKDGNIAAQEICQNGENIASVEFEEYVDDQMTKDEDYDYVQDDIHEPINEITDTENSLNTETQVVYSVDELGVIRRYEENNATLDSTESTSCDSKNADPQTEETPNSQTSDSSKPYETEINYYYTKMQKLVLRKSYVRSNLDGLNKLQDFYKQQVVDANIPDEKYLPRNVFLDKTSYVLNIDVVRNQNAVNVSLSRDDIEQIPSPPPRQGESRTTGAPDETELQNFQNQTFHSTSYRYRGFYRPSRPWRLQQNCNTYYTYNMTYTQPNTYLHPRYRFEPYSSVRHYVPNHDLTMPHRSINQRDNNRNPTKIFHRNTILDITRRFKRSLCTPSQIRALHSLLNTYNTHYGENLAVTTRFNIIDRNIRNDVNIIEEPRVKEVIVLDEEPKRKKARVNNDEENMKQNLDKLKGLASKLKDLEMKGLAVSRHRRCFSNAIKTFNKYFKADIYLDSNFEIIDRKLVVIDSSDSDAVITVEEPVKGKSKKRKKIRNPYSILKRNNGDEASTSRQVQVLQTLSLNVNNFGVLDRNRLCENGAESPISNNGDALLKYFKKGWLPSDEDFGRAEVCSRVRARLDAIFFEQEYINELLQDSGEFENWVDLKISVLGDFQRTLEIQKQQAAALSTDFFIETESQIQPIVKSDCTDLRTALKQLAIIPTNEDIPPETSLRIDFDVYNREVNIKKTNLPKPNFRVICLSESTQFPSSDDVVSLQSKYTDGVPTIFAFIGDSISYLHINQIDLPVFIPDDTS